MSCCFMTTFESISREEVTTEAQVSSAEDSNAKTVNDRAGREHLNPTFAIDRDIRCIKCQLNAVAST